MSQSDCQQLIDSYVEWLRHGLSVEELEGSCELTTPFVDRHNDHLQVYAVRDNGKITLSDDGYVLGDLATSGLTIDTPKRRQMLETTLNGFGIHNQGGTLTVDASTRNLGQRIYSLVQAMLAVNDLFALAQPRVASFFLEDVERFLAEHEVRYAPNVKLAGKTGFDHKIDFLIPRSSERPERLIKAINSPGRNAVEPFLFALTDTREARGDGSRAFAFLNDREREVPGEVTEALEEYDVVPAFWSQRQEHVEALAA